jgi:non-canonical (house-cleaning) NTP pyrophosphatase
MQANQGDRPFLLFLQSLSTMISKKIGWIHSMVIGLASTRKPKVDAVRAVFRRLAPKFGVPFEEIKFIEMEIASGVDETPTSLNHILQGAKRRGIGLREMCQERNHLVDYSIGMEGGLFSVEDPLFGTQTFLQSWAYVTDYRLESFGASGAIAVPDSISEPVLLGKEDLGAVIDGLAKQKNVRSNQGTWGVLTQDLISRQESFELALTSALAPFYNPASYGIRTKPR